MEKLKKISVIETALDQWGWSVDINEDGETLIESNVMYINGPRETDYYHTCGVYEKAGVPFEINEVRHEKIEGLEAYEEYFKSFSDASYEALASGSGLVVAGGFCTYLPGIVGGIQRALGKGKKLGIVYLDAHADIETPEMTRSHIVAGLPVASIVGIGLKEWYDVCGITEPVDSENFILTDYHARSYADDYNIKKAGLDIIDERGFNDRELWIKRIGELAERVDAILLHIDIDIMDSRYVSAFKFPLAPGGQTPEAVMRNIKDVMDTGKVIALTVMDVCFESEREGHEITYLNAMRILGTCLENWKELPKI